MKNNLKRGPFSLKEGTMGYHPILDGIEYHNTGTNYTTYNTEARVAAVLYKRADGYFEVMVCPVGRQKCGASNQSQNYTKVTMEAPELVKHLKSLGFNNRDRNLYHKDYQKRFDNIDEARALFELYEEVVLTTPTFTYDFINGYEFDKAVKAEIEYLNRLDNSKNNCIFVNI